MTPRGRALRYTAISALVVLCLTGFSTGRHGHGGDGGGGCSSSGQDHDGSSSASGGGDTYKDDDDTYGSGGGHHDYDDDTDDGTGGGSGGTGGIESATLTLVACAEESQPYATVEAANPNGGEYTFPVTVLFKDADGTTISERSEQVTVPADGVAAVRVPFDGSGTPDHCELDTTIPSPVL
ncbi:hypothetical protein B9W64_21035 [Streptomyces sp. CS159]|uniref:hypothetical protein n=1 Tax=Streptomyces sp. CS159 TaxID=1982762 RepID=UPI000B40ABA3|nr:hypothetical protein [Streptomyces sp. CS159]OWA10816.1 hypothetical protein B9W64_21035 [Streptomyces sp. CS159]